MNITINQNYIPINCYKYIHNIIYKKDSWWIFLPNSAYENTIKDIRDFLLKEFNYNMNKKVIISIKNHLTKNIIINSHKYINDNIDTIAKEYNGMNIIELFKKYKYPPLNLLKTIFYTKYDSDTIYHLFNIKFQNDTNTTIKDNKYNNDVVTKKLGIFYREHKYIDKLDIIQYKIALFNDANNYINKSITKNNAIINENNLVSFIKTTGLNIETEESLKQKQLKQFNETIATPDIVFKDKVYINGKLIKWIDYKNFAYCGNTSIDGNNIKKYFKYKQIFGEGMFVYRYGVVENVDKDNILRISETDFKNSFKIKYK